jgi:Mce-associated membrane protein
MPSVPSTPRPRVAGLRRPEDSTEPQDRPTAKLPEPEITEDALTEAADHAAAERRRQREERRATRVEQAAGTADMVPAAQMGLTAFASRNILSLALIILAVVLAVAAVIFRGLTADLSDGGVASNRALTDAQATRDVSDRVTEAIQVAMSFDPAVPTVSQTAADTNFTGAAHDWWNCTFSKFRGDATRDKRSVRVTVPDIGVSVLQGDRADLLASVVLTYNPPFGDEKQSVSYLQLRVGAVRQGDQWKIDTLGTTTKLANSTC